MIAPWFAHSLLWLGFWFAGMVMIGTAMFGHAWISHCWEFRADALAAELLGDTRPVLAMLDDCQAGYERLGRMARLSHLMTYPSPTPADGASCSARVWSETQHALCETRFGERRQQPRRTGR